MTNCPLNYSKGLGNLPLGRSRHLPGNLPLGRARHLAVGLDLVLVVERASGGLFRGGDRVVGLDLLGVLILRNRPLVFHAFLHWESLSLVTRRWIGKNLPSMAEGNPDPMGGAVAAQVASLAASLAAAAADRSRDQWAEAGGACAQAQSLSRRTAKLAGRDAAAYAAARDALARRGLEAGARVVSDDQQARDWRLGTAVEQAAEPPLELAARSADIAELAVAIAVRGAPDVRADAVVAALLAAASARAAAHLVQINLVVSGDPRRVALAQGYADAATSAAASVDIKNA